MSAEINRNNYKKNYGLVGTNEQGPHVVIVICEHVLPIKSLFFVWFLNKKKKDIHTKY